MIKSSVLAILTLAVPITLIEFLNNSKPKHPYAGLNIEDLVKAYGYGIETHQVVTDDGYILTLHRIPYGREATNERRIPILMMHGFAQSAKDYINLGPNKALSLILADRGYDVWLGNMRGNTCSRKHLTLDPVEDKKFWDFSMHESGVFDVPAFIDHILNVTGEDSLQYVGYSQGTQVFFIMGSEKPQYLEKVTFMTALAPAVFLNDPAGPIVSVVVPLRKALEFVFWLLNFHDLLSEDSFISIYLRHMCNEHSMFVDVCLHHIFLFNGYNQDQVNMSELSLIHAKTPAGASPKQIIHLTQLIASGQFHRYDLGSEGNLKKYGQEEPPHYNLSKITTPVALYYSRNDYSINIKNIDKVVQSLPNVIKRYQVPLELFSHNDFIYAKDVVELLYNEVVDEILRH